MAQPIRVLVFGTTGVGKTSVCNTLAGLEPGDPGYMKTSNDAVGTTFESHHYKEFHYGGKDIVITDTAGLHEGSNDPTVNPKHAIAALIRLLIDSKDGYNLLIYVTENRITKLFANNYNMFHKVIGSEKIKIIIIVNKINTPFKEWVNANRKYYGDYKYTDIIATSFARIEPEDLKTERARAQEEINRQVRQECREAVLQSIVKHGQGSPIEIYKPHEFLKMAAKIINAFLVITVFAKDKLITVDQNLAKELEEKWGFTRDEVLKFINSGKLPPEKLKKK